MMTLAQAHALLPGSTVLGSGELTFTRVHTDTRSIEPGDLFVALRGERFDGHEFIAQARARGAVAVLASRADALGQASPGGLPGLLVADTLAALQQLAQGWRHRFHLPLVAVAGSNGKTTVTQMVAAILRAAHGSGMLATAGNLNNHIGVPLTLLRLRQDDEHWHRAAVVELGMNHPGEIARLAALAQPTVALVNNAQREHQEFMKSVEAVADENGAVIDALPAGGTVVIPADDAFTPRWRARAGARRVLSFGAHASRDSDSDSDRGADVVASGTWDTEAAAWALTLATPAGSTSLKLHLPGTHNLRNAAAAAACALAAGEKLAAVQAGLEAFRPVAGRSQLHRLSSPTGPVTLVDDSYNANPDSVLAAIEVLAGLPGPRWLILGDMGEVGEEGPRFHAEVGERARERGIEAFWAAGALCAHAGAGRHFESTAELAAALQVAAQRPVARSVLVKGSRFMKMEQVVQALRTAWGDAPCC
ncbi:MAG: UDP-N-acetylmuramoyl-tripeptide--D-alanyl-D-alanine ligase [Betaproteobacteria bacterium]